LCGCQSGYFVLYYSLVTYKRVHRDVHVDIEEGSMNRKTGVVAAVAALVLLLGTASLALGQPMVTIDPTAGYYGQRFEITCTGYLPGDEVTQTYYWPDGSLCFSEQRAVDANGDVDCRGWTAGPGEPTGVYRVVVSGVESGSAEATFEVWGEEFVPEAGSVLLLGSGLMGLAGYAGLKYRGRRS
jgi:hypothetical protein